MKRIWISALPALFLIFMGFAWSLGSPVGSSADEEFHLASTWCAWGNSDSCVRDNSNATVKVPERVAKASCFAHKERLNARCTWLLTDELVSTDRVNPSTGVYPPVFYASMRMFVGPDVARSVLVMRIFNSALAGALLGLALWCAPGAIRRAVGIVWLVSLIPIGIFFIASVNPSSWTIIGCGLFWAFLWSALRNGGRKSPEFVVAVTGCFVTAAMALGSRADSVLVLALSILGVVVMEGRRVRWRWAIPVLGVCAIAMGVLGWVFHLGRYLQTYSVSFPSGNPSTDQPNPVIKTLLELPSFVIGIFGGQGPAWTQRESQNDWGVAGYSWHGFTYGAGSLDILNPSIVGALAAVCVSGVCFLGLSRYNSRKAIVLVILISTFVIEVIFMRALVGFGAWWSASDANWSLQPRYFLPIVMVIIAFCVTTFPESTRVVNRLQYVLLAGAMSVSAIAALAATTSRYVNGQDHSWLQFDPESGWWWSYGPSPSMLIGLGALASIGFMWSFSGSVLGTSGVQSKSKRTGAMA